MTTETRITIQPIHALRLAALWAISIAVLLGTALNRSLEAQTAQTAQAKLLAKLNAVDHNLQWAAYGPQGIIVVMPYGPCATLSEMAPTQIGLSTGSGDDRIVLYPTWESATLAARRHCVAQFAHTKANRTAMAEINAQWMKDHPQGDNPVPVLIERPAQPRLPEGVQSEIFIVQATVDEHGQVTHVNVSRDPNSYLDEDDIVAYVKQCKFRPAVKAGKPFAASISFEIETR